jgi:hypothetical protein
MHMPNAAGEGHAWEDDLDKSAVRRSLHLVKFCTLMKAAKVMPYPPGRAETSQSQLLGYIAFVSNLLS